MMIMGDGLKSKWLVVRVEIESQTQMAKEARRWHRRTRRSAGRGPSFKRVVASQLSPLSPQRGLRSLVARALEILRAAGNPDPYVKSHHSYMLATNLNSTKCCVGQI